MKGETAKFKFTGSVSISGNLMSLVKPDLKDATTIPSGCCFAELFTECTEITSLSTGLLPATTLKEKCYFRMFYNCTGLTTLPEGLLPATTLENYCYDSMFYVCKGLTVLPEKLLPAMALAEGCYHQMFYDCESLVTAPELIAKTLVNNCYRQMFYNCTSLSSVVCHATSKTDDCTNNWLYGVPSGYFYTPNETIWSKSSSGIPENWKVNIAVVDLGEGGSISESDIPGWKKTSDDNIYVSENEIPFDAKCSYVWIAWQDIIPVMDGAEFKGWDPSPSDDALYVEYRVMKAKWEKEPQPGPEPEPTPGPTPEPEPTPVPTPMPSEDVGTENIVFVVGVAMAVLALFAVTFMISKMRK